MTVLADTSAWIDYLRGTGSAVDEFVRAAIAAREPPGWTPPVLLEVEVGTTDPPRAAALRHLVTAGPVVAFEPATDWRNAAELHRAARRTGRTVRPVMDCMIAAVAIRAGGPVLHRDRDHDVLDTVSGLRVIQPG